MFLTEEEVSAKPHDFNERSFPLACYASSGHQLSPLASRPVILCFYQKIYERGSSVNFIPIHLNFYSP